MTQEYPQPLFDVDQPLQGIQEEPPIVRMQATGPTNLSILYEQMDSPMPPPLSSGAQRQPADTPDQPAGKLRPVRLQRRREIAG